MAGCFFVALFPIFCSAMVILTYFIFVICAQDLIYTEFFSQGDKVRSFSTLSAEHTLFTYFAKLEVKNELHCFHDFGS